MAQFFYPEKKLIIPDNSETARYLGYKKTNLPEAEIQKMIADCAEKMQKIMQPASVFEIFDLNTKKNENSTIISFGDLTFTSKDLGINLQNCSKVAIFAATLGPQVDALIHKAEIISPVEAAVFQATGAMYIEVICDLLNTKITGIAAEQGMKTKPRYSPGYGDVPLTIQKDFFRLLPCTRIGLTLMDTLIMAPEKSVTAFVGFYQ